MSLFGAMRTSISGMAAQSNRLGAVADNISNANTTGYKRASIEFETLLGTNTPSTYTSGGVTSVTRSDLSAQGTLQQTSSVTDLAIQGNGFFTVTDNSGATYLTRAGSFVADSSGNLVNTAGYKLLGYRLNGNGDDAVNTSLAALEPVNISQTYLLANATTKGTFSANLPSTAEAVAASSLPSANTAGTSYTAKSSMVAYDNLGTKQTLDVYLTKTGDNAWEMAVFNQADATSGGFPYSSGPLATQSLAFDGSNGKLLEGGAISLAVPNGKTISIDYSGMTQLAASFSPSQNQTDGNAPTQFDHVEIGSDGTVSAMFTNGQRTDLYKVPLADVPSPENLAALSGNVYAETPQSGRIVVGSPNTSGLGKLVSSSLENSNVDLATELTTMIESQRGYSANSQVFQTGSQMLQELLTLRQ